MVELTTAKGARPALERHRTFWWGLMALGLVTAIWGYSNIVIRELEFTMRPAAFLLLRYGLVGVGGIPWLFSRKTKLSPKAALWGLAVGFFLATATLSQAISMNTIPVDSVAFITALYVILTPLVVTIWRRKAPHRVVIAAALASLIGVALLVGHVTVSAAIGTVWSLAAAIFATFQIIGTAEVSQRTTTLQLTVLEALGAAMTLALYLFVSGGFQHHLFHVLTGPIAWLMIWRFGYLAIFGTLVAGILQVWGQRQLSATEAALVFNMEPVWTAVFSWLVFSQFLRWLQLVGAALILVSLIALSVQQDERGDLEIAPGEAPYREH